MSYSFSFHNGLDILQYFNRGGSDGYWTNLFINLTIFCTLHAALIGVLPGLLCKFNAIFFVYSEVNVSIYFLLALTFLFVLLLIVFLLYINNLVHNFILNWMAGLYVNYEVFNDFMPSLFWVDGQEIAFELYLEEAFREDPLIYSDLKFKPIFWWEPWAFDINYAFPPFDKKFFNSPWHFYYMYRLSTWLRWHILEDRICIFVLIFFLMFA